MNKTQLTDLVAKKAGLSLKDARRAVNAVFSTAPREGIIATEVANGKRVQITGFGTFESRKRKKHARLGRHIDGEGKPHSHVSGQRRKSS